MSKKKYRSQEWFNTPDNQSMTSLYLERYLNYGLTGEELHFGKPLIAMAQTVIPFEFPNHPIQL